MKLNVTTACELQQDGKIYYFHLVGNVDTFGKVLYWDVDSQTITVGDNDDPKLISVVVSFEHVIYYYERKEEKPDVRPPDPSNPKVN